MSNIGHFSSQRAAISFQFPHVSPEKPDVIPMDDLRVPKIATQISLELNTGTWIEGMIFLTTASPSHPGPEWVYEFLNETDPYFPLKSSDTTSLIRKASVIQIRITREKGLKELDPQQIFAQLARKVPVSIEIATKEVLTGEFLIIPDSAAPRLLDWLNSQGTFLPLLTGDHLIYISQWAVCQIKEK